MQADLSLCWQQIRRHLFTWCRSYLFRRRFDFQSPSRMDRNVEMFLQIEKSLVSNKCYIPPCIYIKPSLDKALISRLKDIIKRHQGSLAETPEDATHIIHGLPANQEKEGTKYQNLIIIRMLCSERYKVLIRREMSDPVCQAGCVFDW